MQDRIDDLTLQLEKTQVSLLSLQGQHARLVQEVDENRRKLATKTTSTGLGTLDFHGFSTPIYNSVVYNVAMSPTQFFSEAEEFFTSKSIAQTE